MYQKENSSWVKHADFTICDMLCLQLAFVLAYWIRNGIDQPYETELYRNVAVVMFLIPVSYTHLDVYKRQHVMCGTWNIYDNRCQCQCKG